MVRFSQKLYIRVALAITLVAMTISVVAGGLAYWYGLNQQQQLNTRLINQLAVSVARTSAIAAYLQDSELAQEIANGLILNDLVIAVELNSKDGMSIINGHAGSQKESIKLPLVNPFIADEVIGELIVHPNTFFIQGLARKSAMSGAIAMIVLSIFTAFFVSLYVQRHLTRPLRNITKSFAQVKPDEPLSMQPINIGYRRADEIGILIAGINALMQALKLTFQSELALRERTEKLEKKFRLIFENATTGIGLIGSNNNILAANPAFKTLFGEIETEAEFTAFFIEQEKVLFTLMQLRTSDTFNQISMDLEYRQGSNKGWLHCIFAKVSDSRSLTRIGDDTLLEVIVYDITDRTEREQLTRFEADHDVLTKLQNRRSGERKLEELLESALKWEQVFVLMMIDLDKFKPVNDTHGHDVGDIVLVETTRRVRQHFVNLDAACIRWGGDEFVIGFCRPFWSTADISKLSQQLIESLREPIAVEPDIICQISASIGIVIAPEHGTTLKQLLHLSDQTMYEVKQNGRDQFLIASLPDSD
ncbi:diguanylate cyclase [Alteromonadaceae bacterium BrNp21-10]|nr:diguanylate cyclase [Alteromonadaceae bacterium BrNp21-10]